jgi:hypothetical protein
MSELYGQTNADKLAEENNIVRKIVSEIINFGISERQKYLLMYYLSLELENVENAQVVSNFIKEIVPNLTITGIYEGGT